MNLNLASKASILAGMLSASTDYALATPTVYGNPAYTPGLPSYTFSTAISLPHYVNSSGLNAISLQQTNPSSPNNPQGIVTIRWNVSSAVELQGYDGFPCIPTAISDAGTIYGFVSVTPPPGSTPYISSVKWPGNTTAPVLMSDLGTSLSNVKTTRVLSVNSNDLAVGWSTKTGFNGSVATRWDSSNNITELGTVGISAGGALQYVAEGVNQAGTTVGSLLAFTAQGSNGGRYAIRWNAGGTAATLIGTGYTPKKINSSGIIGGSDGNNLQAVRWDADATTPSLLRGTGGAAVETRFADLNDSGFVVGSAGSHASFWNPNTVNATLLAEPDGYTTNSYVSDINSDGLMVGHALKTVNDLRALMWDFSGNFTDLNSLIDPNSGWTLQIASYISDSGWITGRGMYDPDGAGGQSAYQRTFTLQIPEPGSSALILGCGFLMLRRRHS